MKKRSAFATYKNAWQFYALVNQILPNPDTVLRKQGGGIGIYREMFADDQVSACLESRHAPVLASEWTLDKGQAPAKLHTFVEKWLKAVTDGNFVETLLEVVFWGYQPVEMVGWDVSDGLWKPGQLATKPPEWFNFWINDDGNTELRFLSKQNPIDGEPPPDGFTMICPAVKPSYENPYGRGVAGRCFWPRVFKKGGLEFWMNFAERYAMPWVKGRKANPVDQTEVDNFRDDLEEMVQDAVIVLTGDDDADLMSDSGKSSSSDVYERLCTFMDQQISKAILSQTLTTEVADKGALATAKVHGGVREDIIAADLKIVRQTLQQVVNLITTRNGWPKELAPKVRPYEEEDIRTVLAERDEKLSSVMEKSGLRLSAKYFKENYRLTDADIEESAATPLPQPAFAEPEQSLESLNSAHDEIDGLAKQGADASAPDLEEFVSQLLEAIREAGSYEEALNRAVSAFPYKTAEEIGETIARAMFNAHIWGRVSQ